MCRTLVVASGSRLRITAQLINVDDGFHVWSERFDREAGDIFAVQDEITTSIAWPSRSAWTSAPR